MRVVDYSVLVALGYSAHGQLEVGEASGDLCAQEIRRVMSRPLTVNHSGTILHRAKAHEDLIALPIWFGLPDVDRFPASTPCEQKQHDFAPLVPGNLSTYIYDKEDAYYRQYADSFFGITKQKAGWECLRHYEILASGAVPFFEQLDELREKPFVLFPFPKDLVFEAMHLPGVDYANRKIDRSIFDVLRYCDIRDRLLDYTKQYLTTDTLADYFIWHLRDKVGIVQPRILYVSTIDVEYGSGFLYHGLFKTFGFDMSAWNGRKTVLFDDHANDSCYGRGFSFKSSLRTPPLYKLCDESVADRTLHDLMHSRLGLGYFNVIVVTNARNLFCDIASEYGHDVLSTLNGYLDSFPNTAVVTVDGSDFCGCHTTYADQLRHVDLHFRREAEFRSEAECYYLLHTGFGLSSDHLFLPEEEIAAIPVDEWRRAHRGYGGFR